MADDGNKTSGSNPAAWILLTAAAIALGAGAAYLWKWQQGLRGVDLLGFTALWVAVPLALSMLLMFVYFNKQRKG